MLAALLAVLGLAGLVFAGIAISGQVMPRKFTAAQRHQIEVWEIARRWRVTPKTRIFPFSIHYRLVRDRFGFPVPLKLTARRLDIARQAACARGAADVSLARMLGEQGCQTMLRATYTDASSSLVLTVGVAVLRNGPSATATAANLTGKAPGAPGAVTVRPVIGTFRVGGSPAAAFGNPQRQVSWAVSAGPYLVVATVGYADGRPHEAVTTDSYAFMEMTSLAGGVAAAVAAPLGAPPPVPRCPGVPAC